jgi:hypothetical protein
MRPETPLPFTSRGEFTEAVLTAIAATRRELTLVDRDFSDWPLESPAGRDALAAFLDADPLARIRLLVADPDWIERRAPRLLNLRRRHATAIDCRCMPASLFAEECLLLGDRRHLVRRPHRDSFRGRLALAAPADVEPLARRYDAMWDESTPCLPATTLGL